MKTCISRSWSRSRFVQRTAAVSVIWPSLFIDPFKPLHKHILRDCVHLSLYRSIYLSCSICDYVYILNGKKKRIWGQSHSSPELYSRDDFFLVFTLTSITANSHFGWLLWIIEDYIEWIKFKITSEELWFLQSENLGTNFASKVYHQYTITWPSIITILKIGWWLCNL